MSWDHLRKRSGRVKFTWRHTSLIHLGSRSVMYLAQHPELCAGCTPRTCMCTPTILLLSTFAAEAQSLLSLL